MQRSRWKAEQHNKDENRRIHVETRTVRSCTVIGQGIPYKLVTGVHLSTTNDSPTQHLTAHPMSVLWLRHKTSMSVQTPAVLQTKASGELRSCARACVCVCACVHAGMHACMP